MYFWTTNYHHKKLYNVKQFIADESILKNKN